ncbi:MAG: hypothetical protein ACE5KZ_07380 [Candidatus Scalinduaceae bacterium]
MSEGFITGKLFISPTGIHSEIGIRAFTSETLQYVRAYLGGKMLLPQTGRYFPQTGRYFDIPRLPSAGLFGFFHTLL